jgi:hypothetical protein
MYQVTKAKHDALAQAMSQLFKPIYDAEYRHQYPNELDFYKNTIQFITLTFKQTKTSMHDRVGLSCGSCPYQKPIAERYGGFAALQSKNISELRHLANKYQIQNVGSLHKLDLIFAIEDRMGIKHPRILQRPLVAIRPKPHPLKIFDQLHFNIARACLGSNLQRKLRYQPIALAYVDFENTRNGASVDPLKSSWVHVHAVMFVRPNQINKLNKYRKPLMAYFEAKKAKREIKQLNNFERQFGLTSEQSEKRLHLHKLVRDAPKLRLSGDLGALHEVKIEPYNPANPLANLMGYSSKGADQVPTQLVQKDNRICENVFSGADDLYQVFPRQLEH